MNQRVLAVGTLTVLVLTGISLLHSLDQTGTPQATFHVDGSPTVSLTTADTPAERRTGLMGRESLCRHCGMLFIFPSAQERVFWMKNTSIPLDIIYLSPEKRVITVRHADPPAQGTPEEQLQRYPSNGLAQYVIEVPQGYAQEYGIVPGTQVSFRHLPRSE